MSEQKIQLKNKEIKEIELDKFDNLFIEVLDESSLTLKLANFENKENLKISAKIGKNSTFTVIFGDFSNANIHLISNVELVEEGANCTWHLATLASKNNSKIFDISFKHLVGNTVSLMDNYGVSKDKANIVFTGSNHIVNGAKKSVTKQNAKIIVFDKESRGTASPILKIDENDVQASHGAVVGQLNSDHLFYLMSRGLSKEEARMVITLGYLKPISNKFSESIQNRIEECLKEEI